MCSLGVHLHYMNSYKVMQAQPKSIKSTWENAHGGGAGCMWFKRSKKHPANGGDLNDLVTNAVKIL